MPAGRLPAGLECGELARQSQAVHAASHCVRVHVNKIGLLFLRVTAAACCSRCFVSGWALNNTKETVGAQPGVLLWLVPELFFP